MDGTTLVIDDMRIPVIAQLEPEELPWKCGLYDNESRLLGEVLLKFRCLASHPEFPSLQRMYIIKTYAAYGYGG